MPKVAGVAFLIKCGCSEGKLRLGTIEIDCIRCNGHGVIIQKTTTDEMRRYLDNQQNRK